MTCADLDPIFEAVASGEAELDTIAQPHLQTCPRCAAALALARQVENLLAAREQPELPAGFYRGVSSRIRRERWHEEERFDRLFNVGLIAAMGLILAGSVSLVSPGRVGALLAGSSAMVAETATTLGGRVPISPPVAVLGVLMAVVAALAWWWADRRYSW